MASQTIENYVKTIYLIASQTGRVHGEPVSTGELAVALNVSPGTVTGMLKSLSEAKLASYAPYEGVKLSDQGRFLALKILRRHRLIELFLTQTLELSWDEVHEEAEHLEHAVSDRLIERIDDYLGRPGFDPHGDPIPSADGVVTEPQGQPLSDLGRNDMFKIIRVVEQDSAFLRYLTDCGLDLGTVGRLAEKRPESGAVVLKVSDRAVALGWDAAGKVLVERVSD